jgi:hypothetical protein
MNINKGICCDLEIIHIHHDHWPENENEKNMSGDIFFCSKCKTAQGKIDLLILHKDTILNYEPN